MIILFDKMQGLGNDFVFIKKGELKENLNFETRKFLCDRKFGIGCDTLVIYDVKDSEVNAEFFNSDGSLAEICMNASRCLGLLLEKKFCIKKFTLRSCEKVYKIEKFDDFFEINIGKPSFSHEKLGILNKNIDLNEIFSYLNLEKDEQKFFFDAKVISVGNPHLILFLKNSITDEKKFQDRKKIIGEKLEKFSLFQNRINVSFAKVINETEIQLEVFERGVGFTLACGSGACATAYAAYNLGLTKNNVTVHQPGGLLRIEILKDSSIIQKGPAKYVFEGKIDIDFQPRNSIEIYSDQMSFENFHSEKSPQKNSIKIYTDGACLGNPGPGGWAAILIFDNGNIEKISGGDPDTTNNRMELSAAINALKSIDVPSEIELFTDSTYVKNGITSWIKNWERNGWKNSENKSVKNKELWLELRVLEKRHTIKWHWVKGHNGNEFNEKVDELSRQEAMKFQKK